VEVDYDPQQVTLREMVRALQQESSLYSVMAGDRTAHEALRAELPGTEVTRTRGQAEFIESKHSLRTRFPDLYYLDLTERQAIALNSWSYFGGEMPEVLSSSQKVLHARLKRKLRETGPPAFQPVREGDGRERYRERLLQWLGDA